MSASRWMVREIGPQQWWVTDRNTGAAIKLRETEAINLWRMSGDERLRPLAVVRECAEPPVAPFIDLEFLGIRMRYWCPIRECAEEIARQYEGLVPKWRRSPDIEATLEDGSDFGRLHRSADRDRDGVQIREIGDEGWALGSANLPIIPMLQARAFAGRFCALHGALLGTPAGGIAVCGEQKAGKTTTALAARRLGLAVILSDETTLIDRDATGHGVPLPIRERSPSGRRIRALAPVDPRERAKGMHISDIVILQGTDAAPGWCRIDDDAEALRLLVPHLRVLDTSLGEATDRLIGLLGASRLWRWRVRPWPLLADDIDAGLQNLVERQNE